MEIDVLGVYWTGMLLNFLESPEKPHTNKNHPFLNVHSLRNPDKPVVSKDAILILRLWHQFFEKYRHGSRGNQIFKTTIPTLTREAVQTIVTGIKLFYV